AVKEGQLQLVYQPIVELASGRIDKVECLVRWRHPEKGMINPNVFIPFAEDTGLISEIGEWVFGEAIAKLARWRALNSGLQASVNVSPAQFAGDTLQPERWLERMAALDMAGRQLVIEITERLLMDADTEVV